MSFSNSQYDVVLAYPPAEVVMEIWDTPRFPAIGLAYVANYLANNSTVVPAVIDGRLSRFTLQETVDQIVDLNPKIVGISAMTHMVHTASRLAAEVKKIIKDVKVVLGGFHASALPERTLMEFPSFDYIIAGEAEMAFRDLTEGLLRGQPIDHIEGLWYRKNEEIIGNGRGLVPPTLDELGQPGWHLFDQEVIEKYCTLLPMMGNRGCPFACNFCARPYGRSVRYRSVESICDEIENNLKFLKPGVFVNPYTDVEGGSNGRNMQFYDETFSVDKKFTIRLCEEIVKRGLADKVKWECNVHANTVDENLAKAMKEAGCVQASMGVESGDEVILKQMGKGVTLARIIEAHQIFKDAGIDILGFFTLGHPDETRLQIWRSIRLAIKLNSDITAFGIIVPYPGTEIWEMVQRGEGGYKNLSANWEDYNKQLGDAVEYGNVYRWEMEVYQLVAYTLIFLLNFRIREMFVLIKAQSKLIRATVKKIFSPLVKGPFFHHPSRVAITAIERKP